MLVVRGLGRGGWIQSISQASPTCSAQISEILCSSAGRAGRDRPALPLVTRCRPAGWPTNQEAAPAPAWSRPATGADGMFYYELWLQQQRSV